MSRWWHWHRRGAGRLATLWQRPQAWLVLRWQTRLQPLLQHGRDRWHGLAARERLQLQCMAAVLLAALIWLLWVQPALHSLRYWGEALPRLRSQSVALQEVLAEVGGLQVAPGNLPPAKRLAFSLDQAGLAGRYRLQSRGAELELTFTPAVDAVRLTTWLLHAPAALGLTVQQLTLERLENTEAADQPLLVQASLCLQANTRDGT